jgi:glycolate oxidase FAD binding subunit
MDRVGEGEAESIAGYREILLEAQSRKARLRIVGGDTKRAWWRSTAGQVISLADFVGIIDYAPSELVVTARAGTRLRTLEKRLAEAGQMLGFEPPHTGDDTTIGGAVSAGLSGPARAYRGGARDFVLGVRLLTAAGEVLRFGGRVMKNVAGYDVSRLATGAWGRLGVLLDVSLRVVPRPATEVTARWRCDAHDAWQRSRALARQVLPVTACRFDGECLDVRLGGSPTSVRDALDLLAPEAVQADSGDWADWRDYANPFFRAAGPLWRVVVPAATPPLPIAGICRWDWGGALRWYRQVDAPDTLLALATRAGGHLQPWPSSGPAPETSPLAARVVASFDPHGRFNPF